MLITFKSKAFADITMFREHAERILNLLDKNAERGIMLHSQLAQAIQTIEAAVKANTENKVHSASNEVKIDASADPFSTDVSDGGHEKAEGVSFAARAYPLLQMLRASEIEGCDVVWGV